MAVPSSGQLRLRGDIALEVDGSATGSNVSLRTLSASAGFSTPDNMSEFYGYTSAVAPSVTTNSLTSIGETSMTLNGNVTSDGGASITQRGFYFGTNSSSPTNNTKYTVGGTTGSYILNRTGLSAGTTYYCWSFATNSSGTTYGSRVNANTIAAYNPNWQPSTYSTISAPTLVNCAYDETSVSIRSELYYRNPNTGSYVLYGRYEFAAFGGQSFAWSPNTEMTNYSGRPNSNYAVGTRNLLYNTITMPSGISTDSNVFERIGRRNVSNVSISNNGGTSSNGSTSEYMVAQHFFNNTCRTNTQTFSYWDIS
jgi:hypothetical protein